MKAKGAALSLCMLLGLTLLLSGCLSGGDAGGVATEKIKSGSLNDSLFISGRTEARDSANIIPKVAGKVLSVPVDVGSQVRKGDTLIIMEAPEAEAALGQTRSAVDAAAAALDQAQADLGVQRANYDRAQQLLEDGAISQGEFENKYLLPYEAARLRAEKSGPAQLGQARATLQQAEAAYQNYILKAPLDGEVTSRQINPGEYAAAGKTLLFVAGLGDIVVRAFVDEDKFKSLAAGQEVMVKIASLGKSYRGTVSNISATLDVATKNYAVEILLNDIDGAVKPGMLAQIRLGKEDEAFVIPLKALHKDGEKYSVFILEGGKALQVPVTLERGGESLAVVRGALGEGQDLIIYSDQELKDGLEVSPRS